MRLIDADSICYEHAVIDGDAPVLYQTKEYIDKLQTVGGWISVKDRMPPAHGIVIVSINDDRGDTSYRYTDTGWYLSDGKCWIVDNEATISVEAWMPLPKPYEPPEEE